MPENELSELIAALQSRNPDLTEGGAALIAQVLITQVASTIAKGGNIVGLTRNESGISLSEFGIGKTDDDMQSIFLTFIGG